MLDRPRLSVGELNELAGALLDCFCIRDRATRDSLLLSLGSDPIGQYVSVNRQAHDRADVISIVHAFAAYSGGLTILLSGIELFEPGTLAVERVRNLIARLEPDPLVPRDQFTVLQALLTQIEFADADTLYWKAVGPYGPSPSGPTRDLASLARDLTDVNSGGGPLPPLLVFLEMLATRMPDHRQSLHRWIDRHAAHWSLDPVAVFKNRLGLDGPQPTMEEKSYLVVQLEPYGADSHQYLPAAWFQQGGVSRRLRVSDDPMHADDLAALLNTLLTNDTEVNRDVGSQLMVEVILPRRLINKDVDQLMIEPEGFARPIGVQHPVVVRSFERLSKSPLHREWYRKSTWLKRNGDDPRATAAAVHWILRPDEARPDQLLARFMGEDTPVFLIMAFPAPDAEKLSDDEYAAGVHGGVPMMLWCRDRHPVDNFEQEVRALLGTHSLRMIPELVHRYRRRAHSEGSPDHLGRRLTLLWDDFDRKPEPPKYLLAPTREAK